MHKGKIIGLVLVILLLTSGLVTAKKDTLVSFAIQAEKNVNPDPILSVTDAGSHVTFIYFYNWKPHSGINIVFINEKRFLGIFKQFKGRTDYKSVRLVATNEISGHNYMKGWILDMTLSRKTIENTDWTTLKPAGLVSIADKCYINTANNVL